MSISRCTCLDDVLPVAVLDRVRQRLAQRHQDPVPRLLGHLAALQELGAEVLRHLDVLETAGKGHPDRAGFVGRSRYVHSRTSEVRRILVQRRGRKKGANPGMLPSAMLRKRASGRGRNGPLGRCSWRASPTCLPDRIAEFSRKVEQVRGRKFAAHRSRLRAGQGRAAEGARDPSCRSSCPFPPTTTFGRSPSLGLIEDQPRPARRPGRLLRLPGDRLLRPAAPPVLRRQGRRGARDRRRRRRGARAWRRASSSRTS